jgi:hypothetical protein
MDKVSAFMVFKTAKSIILMGHATLARTVINWSIIPAL